MLAVQWSGGNVGGSLGNYIQGAEERASICLAVGSRHLDGKCKNLEGQTQRCVTVADVSESRCSLVVNMRSAFGYWDPQRSGLMRHRHLWPGHVHACSAMGEL